MSEPQDTISKVANLAYEGYADFSDINKQIAQEFVAGIVTTYLDNVQLSWEANRKIDWATGQLGNPKEIFQHLSEELKTTYPDA